MDQVLQEVSSRIVPREFNIVDNLFGIRCVTSYSSDFSTYCKHQK